MKSERPTERQRCGEGGDGNRDELTLRETHRDRFREIEEKGFTKVEIRRERNTRRERERKEVGRKTGKIRQKRGR